MKKITYKEQTILVSNLLNATKSEVYDILNEDDNGFYNKEVENFNYYEIPVVTEDYMILSHMEDVLAAAANSITEMKVIIASGLQSDDVVRFCFRSVHFKRYPARKRLLLIELLTGYLRDNKKGKKWQEELIAAGYDDINEQLGAVMNCSKETIKAAKRSANELDIEDVTIPVLNIKNLTMNLKLNNGSPSIEYGNNTQTFKKSEVNISETKDAINIKINKKAFALFLEG